MKISQSLTPQTIQYRFYKKSIYLKVLFFFASEIEAHSKATLQCSENISVML